MAYARDHHGSGGQRFGRHWGIGADSACRGGLAFINAAGRAMILEIGAILLRAGALLFESHSVMLYREAQPCQNVIDNSISGSRPPNFRC